MLAGVLSIGVILLLVKNGTAITDEDKAQIQVKFLQSGTTCLKEHPISLDDINSFKEKKFPDGDAAPCFVDCVFKSVGLFDEKGDLWHTGALEEAKKVFEDEEQLKNIEELLNACSKVNNEEVGETCGRAKIAYNCLVEHADKFGFNIDF